MARRRHNYKFSWEYFFFIVLAYGWAGLVLLHPKHALVRKRKNPIKKLVWFYSTLVVSQTK